MFLTYSQNGISFELENPAKDDFRKALQELNKTTSRQTQVFFSDGILTVSCDTTGKRFLVTYKESDPDSKFAEPQCLMDPSVEGYSLDDLDDIFFIAPNGEGHSRQKPETVAKERAIEVAMHIFEHRNAPDDTVWELYIY